MPAKKRIESKWSAYKSDDKQYSLKFSCISLLADIHAGLQQTNPTPSRNMKRQGMLRKRFIGTFPVIISTQYNSDILQQKNQSEGPEDEGKHTEHCLLILVLIELSRECAFINVKRRCA
ncbi:hypothetical protein ZEAMMB73_Zm00001d013285 [Zea mays]|uniref:Uncharacterized protein n=1 Tax=Zea mays TaxID=4577 RepID=A0A1D6GHU1_MAIZE|nr:hypothetical protein ZEAMMB73_Zm00001d013285 [Zea mays]